MCVSEHLTAEVAKLKLNTQKALLPQDTERNKFFKKRIFYRESEVRGFTGLMEVELGLK
jgi:hypothetical protein